MAVELSNIEFKAPGVTQNETCMQNRKDVRLTRSIEDYRSAGYIAVMMLDVTGDGLEIECRARVEVLTCACNGAWWLRLGGWVFCDECLASNGVKSMSEGQFTERDLAWLLSDPIP
ncbi:MAG: hypothetical protein JOS17DRAFT_795379 [Linnemannia elongata]|nr:MAG: hypothetical protein JOS17DRAFT_795379 [Linnemannia elongata]